MQKAPLIVAGVALALLGMASQPVSADLWDIHFQHDDGGLLYDADGDCVGDSNNADEGVALQHWHVGVPMAGPEAEFAGGFGCKGGPRTFALDVPGEKHAFHIHITGSILYDWDRNVNGGGGNELHFHIYDDKGVLVTSTIFTEDPNPVVPGVLDGPRVRELNFIIEPGHYTLVEDVWSGQHTSWVTDILATEVPG